MQTILLCPPQTPLVGRHWVYCCGPYWLIESNYTGNLSVFVIVLILSKCIYLNFERIRNRNSGCITLPYALLQLDIIQNNLSPPCCSVQTVLLVLLTSTIDTKYNCLCQCKLGFMVLGTKPSLYPSSSLTIRDLTDGTKWEFEILLCLK